MPRAARLKSEGGFYHIVNRGIGKQIIFEDDEDYERFLSTISRFQEEEKFSVLAYCLMDNHFHLLLRADDSPAQIMKKISCSYAYYFNDKYGRSGHLFQDRYTSEAVNDEKYLLAVVRYIHNNPQKAGICKREEYHWSSYVEYLSSSGITDRTLVLDLTGGIPGFEEFSAGNEEVECMDISTRERLTDAEAIKYIIKKLKVISPTDLQSYARPERDAALAKLKNAGLSIRQIERLTGINRGVILKS